MSAQALLRSVRVRIVSTPGSPGNAGMKGETTHEEHYTASDAAGLAARLLLRSSQLAPETELVEMRVEVDSSTVHPSEIELRHRAIGERRHNGDSGQILNGQSPTRTYPGNIHHVRSNTLDSNISATSTTDMLPNSPRIPITPDPLDAVIWHDSVPLRDADGLSLTGREGSL